MSHSINNCPHCDGMKDWRAAQCRKCVGPGRPLSLDSIYAMEVGLPLKSIKRAGGAAKLRALDKSARNLLLGIRR